ncbi:Caspase-1 [Varanus komodoensis]|uniref:caspase-1-like n=1 Tax=Varanus komodoensis TaxID=61221 RepID=UPI001CF7D258|nr:caspase-1-like [Varanus komodoensis]KAF7237022.1 Caspase-1 [Varanus komodoensis]
MADAQLQEARTLFVSSASKDVIGWLLDELLGKEVLNAEERDEVWEKAKKQDQARTLIDLVKRKGPKASQLFIEALQRRDAPFAAKLDFSACPSGALVGQPLQAPDPRAITLAGKEQPLQYKDGLVLCPRELFQKIQGQEGSEIYPIKDPKARTRLALIVCNIEFEHCTRRNGAEIDLAQMTQLLEGLDYKVEVETNLCSQGMADCLKHFAAREEHKASDSTFVVLMSHGLRDGLCGTKSSEQHPDILPVDLVFSTFNNKNCRALRGKPKVIIIQACRGENKGFIFVADTASTSAPSHRCAVGAPEGLEKDTIQKVHVESDFICLYSTTPDNVSWRSPQTGSIFIVQLVEEIKKHAWNCNLEEIFRKVMWAFESNPCQMPSKDRTTLSRKFYLFPGH